VQAAGAEELSAALLRTMHAPLLKAADSEVHKRSDAQVRTARSDPHRRGTRPHANDRRLCRVALQTSVLRRGWRAVG
jgi:hypothetical protein